MNEFQKIKPLFDQLLKDYPNKNPEHIVKDMNEKKTAYYLLLENQNLQHEKLYTIQKDQKEESNKYKSQLDLMVNKLADIENEYKDRMYSNLAEISNLKGELETHIVYKKENMKMHSMLFQIYNMLIERFRIDKNMKFSHPELVVEEADFKCNLFDNNEICNYIKSMIILTSKEKSSDILREVIAYSNMMLRLYGADEDIKVKFQPKKCFLLIKKTFESFVNDKVKLQEVLASEKDKIHFKDLEIAKLTKLLKEKELQFATLKKKYAEQFEERLAKSTIRRISIKHERKKLEKNKVIRRGGLNLEETDFSNFITVCKSTDINQGRPYSQMRVGSIPSDPKVLIIFS